MPSKKSIDVRVNPRVTPDQLWDFYLRNDICEIGHGKDLATRVLDFPQETVAAFDGAKLVGLVRASFDGLSAHLWEFSLELELQGETSHRNGSLMEGDAFGIGKRLADALHYHLESLGCTFVTAYGADFEEPFFTSVGFRENEGHKVFYVEGRSYAETGTSDDTCSNV